MSDASTTRRITRGTPRGVWVIGQSFVGEGPGFLSGVGVEEDGGETLRVLVGEG